MSDDSSTRDTNGRFLPGSPPGPGRPRRTDAEREQREAIRNALPGVVGKLTELALAGDVQAARLLMDRALPSLRPVAAPVAVDLGDDLTRASGAVLAALSAGEIATDQASDLAGVLSALARVKEITELESRVAALENRK